MPRLINVLAVDDKPSNLTALEAVLQGEFNVIRANSGPEALDILKVRRDIDIILMDVQMPMLDGFETATYIKQLDSAKDIPIVFITAVYHDDPWVRKGYEVGGVDYISKPFNPEILKLKVGVYACLRQRSEFLKERELQLRISEELLATSRKLASTHDDMSAAVIVADTSGRIQEMSEEVFGIFQCAGRFAGEGAVTPESWDKYRLLIEEQLTTVLQTTRHAQQAYRELLHIRCLDGSEKTVHCTISPLLRHDRSSKGNVVLIHDVTQSRKIKADFERRISKLVSTDISF